MESQFVCPELKVELATGDDNITPGVGSHGNVDDTHNTMNSVMDSRLMKIKVEPVSDSDDGHQQENCDTGRDNEQRDGISQGRQYGNIALTVGSCVSGFKVSDCVNGHDSVTETELVSVCETTSDPVVVYRDPLINLKVELAPCDGGWESDCGQQRFQDQDVHEQDMQSVNPTLDSAHHANQTNLDIDTHAKNLKLKRFPTVRLITKKKASKNECSKRDTSNKKSGVYRQCSVCGQKLKQSQYKKHMSQHKVTGFSCGKCLKLFNSRSNLSRHLKLHNEKKPYACDECSLRFALRSYLKKHKQRGHGKSRRKASCAAGEACDASLQSSQDLSHSQMSYLRNSDMTTNSPQSSSSPFSESLLGASNIVTKFVNVPHQSFSSSSSSVVYPVCMIKVDQNRGELSINDKSKLASDITPRVIKCGVCSEVFSESQREKHEKRHKLKNSIKGMLKCKICSEQCESQADLKRHTATHAGEKHYACDVCPSKFATSSYLKTHKDRVHATDRSFQCSLCPAAFCIKGRLQAHMKIHSQERPMKCDLCLSTFKHSSSLKAHKKTHTEATPFKCDMCPSQFKSAGNLKQHKRIHSDERPYQCEFCKSAFKHSTTLKIHRRTHTGEKPYLCDQCPKAFTRRKFLDGHRKTHLRRKGVKNQNGAL